MKACEGSAPMLIRVDGDLDLLVAAGLRRPIAERVLAQLGGIAAASTATALELRAAGVPPAASEKLAAAFAFGRRAAMKAQDKPRAINQPSDVYDLLWDLRQECVESFHIIAVDVRNGLIARKEIARGSVAEVQVSPRDVFREAARLNAAGITIAHNHPSGDPTPSPEDIAITRRMRECGDLIGIPVLDHIIVASAGYRSIAEWMGSEWR